MVLNTKRPITWWKLDSEDGFGGGTFAAPQVLTGRWELSTERFMTQGGEEEYSRAVAYIQDAVTISVGDFLYNGESSQADPNNQSGSDRVRGVDQIPDLAHMRYDRVAFL